MAAIRNVYENALVGTFFATLKREKVYLHDYQTFAEAAAHLERFLEDVYNYKRLHSVSATDHPASSRRSGLEHQRTTISWKEGPTLLWLWSMLRGAPHLLPQLTLSRKRRYVYAPR
jgi:hypothetical protein